MADEGLSIEAWSMPHVGTLTKKFVFTKSVESFTFNDRFNDLGDGVMTMPDDFPLKAELFNVDEANHANDAGSMIRVLRGTTPILHQLITRSEDSWSDGEPTHKLTTEGLEWILDRVLVPNYDHPADPFVEPDWIYGAPSILANTGLEDGGATNLLIHVWIESTVTAGTWTITFGAQTTGALAWNIDAPALQTAIEGLSNIQDILIAGAGTETNPWVIEVIDPGETNFNVSVADSLTGGAPLMLLQHNGAVGVVDPWTRSFNPLTGLFHGTYTNFQISTTTVRSGTTSLYVKGALGSWPDSFPGAQQIVQVTGGRTYRAKVWINPAFARTYRFVIRTTDETYIGGVEAALTASSWQEMAFSVTIPEHVREIIFRVACISNTNGHEFYLDDALLAPGFDAATLGKMLADVRTAAIAVGSPLTWLTPTWTTTLDSDGVAWDQTRMWNVNHGQTFLQLIEYARKWNYEFRIRWDAADARFEWDMWNPTGGGQTRTGIAITGKSGVMGSAPIVRRPPGATYMKTEGQLGHWGEFASTTLDDVWGRLEKFHQDRQGVDSSELDVLAQRMITRTEANTASRSITVSDPSLLPWTSYEPGDIVTLNLAPKDVKKALRVAAIVVSKGPNDAAPKYDVHFGAPVYSDDAAIAQGLKTLIREFRRPIPATVDGKPIVPNFALGGSAPTLVIAANDSSDSSKGRADFICLGTDDHLTFQTAVSQIYAGGGGRLLLTEGTFNFAGTVFLVPQTPNFIRFEGMGVNSTVIAMAAAANSHAFHVFTGNGGRVEFANLQIDGQKATQTSGSPAGINAPANGETDVFIDNCDIKDFRGYGVLWVRHAGRFLMHGSTVTGNTIDGLHLNWEGQFIVSDCDIFSNGRHGIKADLAQQILVHNNRIYSNTNEGFSAGGGSQPRGQVITDNYVYSNGGTGILLDGHAAVIAGNFVQLNAGNGLSINGFDSPSLVSDNHCITNTLIGFVFGGTIGGVCTGNVAYHNGQHGYQVNTPWHLKGNLAHSNSRTTNNTYDGIIVTADDCDILCNTIRQDTGANKHRNGINISGAGAVNNWVAGNDSRGAVTANYADTGTTTINVWAGAFGDNY